jgi:hypothetical protein
MPTLTTLVNFNGADGATPNAGLISDLAGNLFGTTSSGGANATGGTVFEVPLSGGVFATVPTTLVSFPAGSPQIPAGPQGNLVADANGDLFGTVRLGGVNGQGSVFEIAKTGGSYGTPTTLVDFNSANGSFPYAGLITDSAGDLFGTTFDGGANGEGTVFEIQKIGTGFGSAPITLASFSDASGADVTGSLVMDASGNLFGAAGAGGPNGDGTVFEVARTGNGFASTPSVVVSFNNANGADPNGLIEDAAGDLFGVTGGGGLNGDGTVFEIVKTAGGYAATPTVLVNFNGANGASPSAGLIMDAAGNLFGATQLGGPSNDGTLFEITDNSGVYASSPTTIATFDGTNGQGPNGQLIADPSGNLFGTTNGESVSSTNDGSVFEVTNSGFQGFGPVSAYYQAILRTPPPAAYLSQTALALDQGTLTTQQVLSQLLSSAQATTVPALLSYDFMVGSTPSSPGLNFLTNFATDLQTGNYTYRNGFVGGSFPGEFHTFQFSVLNTYVNFCATDVQIPGNPFTADFGGLAATPSVADRTAFFQDVYQQIFGVAPAASTTALFVTSPAAADPSITTFQYYVNYAGSELGGYGAVAGVLLSVAESSSPQLGPYPGAVNSFLTQAALSSAAGGDTAPYGSSLLTAFPPVSGAAQAQLSAGDPSDPTVITIAGMNQLVDPGAGSHTIQFLAGSGGDTVMLHSGGVDQISGFDPASDALDVSALLSAANIDIKGGVSALSMNLTVVDQGNDALLRFDPAGQGGGSTVAVLQGLGSSVTGLDSLISHGAIRMT